MIRNILYSLFLHFLLILLIYANFNLKTVVEPKTNEISISLMEVDATKNVSKIKKIEGKIPAKKQKKPIPKKDLNEIVDQPLPDIRKEEIKKAQEDKIEEPAKEITEKKKEEKPKEKEPIKEFVEKKKEPIKEVVEKKKEEKPKEIEVKKEPKKEEEKPKKEEKPKEIENSKPQKESEKKQENSKNDKEDKSVNNLENIDLSVREKFNIQSQLKACYKRALVESGAKDNKIRITIIAEVTQDGFINSDLEEVIDSEKYDKDTNYRTTVNNVRRAVELCSPLRNLPLEKYEIWKKVLLEFGEEQ